ncbi:hypothetical protein C8Q80DRAFT_145882 [Daedaleopsis nitida]|nr:hypothetical protein C8Q80DRAFT_145882 [Daedaleopsis nitida]
MVKLILINAVTLACAVAVSGVSLSTRSCDYHDAALPTCETTLGSPLVADCQEALKHLATRCNQSNAYKSSCTTQITVRTCKIDVCGPNGSQILDGVNCGGYLQTILNHCQWNGRVGGYILPAVCNVFTPYLGDYKLQFSHS